MSWRIFLRLTLSAWLASAVLPATFAQSQETQSVAEAARRAKEQKKAPAKPAKVITDETLDVKKGDVQSAAAEEAKMPGAPATNAQAPASAPAAASTAAPARSNAAAGAAAQAGSQDGEKAKEPKEVSDLKEQIKQALFELDLLQRQLRLDQDTVYSKTNYASDKAGIAKVDAEKQQVTEKQQDVDALKAKLADLLKSLGIDASAAAAPPKP